MTRTGPGQSQELEHHFLVSHMCAGAQGPGPSSADQHIAGLTVEQLGLEAEPTWDANTSCSSVACCSHSTGPRAKYFHLKKRVFFGGRAKESKKQVLTYAGSLPKCLQKPGLGRAGVRDWNTIQAPTEMAAIQLLEHSWEAGVSGTGP